MSSLEPFRRDTRLDPYVDQYAERTSSMTVSAVRALFSVANRPEVVSLAGGMPNITDLPLGRLGDAFDELVRERGVQAMQYGSGQGELFMREKIVEVMAEEAIHANADDLVITCGSQQALDLVTRIFVDPGDTILCEAPSYVGAMGTFNAYQARIHHVEMDAEGLVPEAVRQATLALRAAGRRVKFLYTIPNFNNPTGITQSLERRRELLAVAHEVDLLVVEDNPYGLLTFDGAPLPALRSMDDQVIYLGSFSKTFAPGFRVGWVLAPHAVRERLTIAQEAAVLSPPVFSQFAIATYLEKFDWRAQIDNSRGACPVAPRRKKSPFVRAAGRPCVRFSGSNPCCHDILRSIPLRHQVSLGCWLRHGEPPRAPRRHDAPGGRTDGPPTAPRFPEG